LYSLQFANLFNKSGVIRCENKVTTPTLLFVEALEVGLERLCKSVNSKIIANITSISASGQQHGSVYWNSTAQSTLSSLSPTLSLHSQLMNSFSISAGPTWQDNSTSKECELLQEAVGGH
jgi:xylulokinase